MGISRLEQITTGDIKAITVLATFQQLKNVKIQCRPNKSATSRRMI